jgi:antitoxin component YwqK of YwqJK toxin-antitoxin module
MQSIFKLKNLLFVFLFMSLTSYSQNKNIAIINKIKKETIIKKYIDTTYYSFCVREIGNVVLKHFDEQTDIELKVDWWRHFYRNADLKDSILYNDCFIAIKDIRYYHNKKIKRIRVYDTTAIPEITKRGLNITFLYGDFYKTIYRKSGIVKREGTYKNIKKRGEWIYYNKKGLIRKRKEHGK